MNLTNENMMIASLLGSKVVKSIPRFEAFENELSKHVIPPVPFLPIRNEQSIKGIETGDYESQIWENDPVQTERQFFPFSLKKESESQFYTLPWEPIININARNNIAKRKVAKAGSRFVGTIKERFSTDDFEITITGALYGKSLIGGYDEAYPKEDMERLRDYLLSAERFKVHCEPLQLLGINYIVIEEMNFPFSKGENVQAYEITATSDFDWDLLYERKLK